MTCRELLEECQFFSLLIFTIVVKNLLNLTKLHIYLDTAFQYIDEIHIEVRVFNRNYIILVVTLEASMRHFDQVLADYG